MPLNNYGVLRGRVEDARREDGQATPHYQLRVRAAGSDFRIAVNVLSQTAPSELLFVIEETFRHPLTAGLSVLDEGFTPLASRPGGLALDYIRANLFGRAELRSLPPSLPGPDNDLSDRLEHYARRAQQEPDAELYAFGQRWGPEVGVPDKIFGFSPGGGVHDIHMNQGNVPPFTRDDGVWQDGGLIFHFPATGQWAAVFLAFQSQAWHTDDRTGHALRLPGLQPGLPDPAPRVRIVGARVYPMGAGAQQVLLLNASPDPLSLEGWALANGHKHRQPLAGHLAPGESRAVPLSPDLPLRPTGDLITLFDAAGLKVDGVAFTAADAARPGWTLVF